MRLEETFIVAVVFIAAMIGVPWLTFALASLFAGFPRLRLQQILGLVGVSAWVFGFLSVLGPPHYATGPMLLATVVGVLICFAGMWTREFRFLMLRRADEFPDRQDKLAWTFVLIAIAPAGVWLFRSYRKARWPEVAEASKPHPLDDEGPAPGFSPPEMPRIGA